MVKKMNVQKSEILIRAFPSSVQAVYRILSNGKPLKPSDIQKKTRLSPRTVRKALKILRSKGYVKNIPDLRDLRSQYYVIA